MVHTASLSITPRSEMVLSNKTAVPEFKQLLSVSAVCVRTRVFIAIFVKHHVAVNGDVLLTSESSCSVITSKWTLVKSSLG
jgi:hypothetical protein